MQTRNKSGIPMPHVHPLMFLTTSESKTPEQAFMDPKWFAVMTEEYDALQENQTWLNFIGLIFLRLSPLLLKPVTIRSFLTLALTNHWDILQLDINKAFLNGPPRWRSVYGEASWFCFCGSYSGLSPAQGSLWSQASPKTMVWKAQMHLTWGWFSQQEMWPIFVYFYVSVVSSLLIKPFNLNPWPIHYK